MTHERMPVAAQVEIYKRVRAEIAEAFELDESDEAVLDSTEGETDLADTLANVLRAALLADAQADGVGELLKRMGERRARLQDRSKRLRAIVLHAMADAGLPKLAAPDFSASLGRSQPRLIVPDDTAVPDEMCRVKREPDKTKIAAALKQANADGHAFNYAYFADPAETLTIRGK